MSTLIITRKVGEAVKIGDDIIVRVETTSRSGKYRLSIQAPRCVKILREELLAPAGRK